MYEAHTAPMSAAILALLLIALLAVAVVLLLRLFRRGASRPLVAAYGHAGVGEGEARSASSRWRWVHGAGEASARNAGRADLGWCGDDILGQDEAPVWLDGPGFLEGVRTLFVRLQAAWDDADLRDIRRYTTPRLCADLERERQKIEGGQLTEVVRLDAELTGIRRVGEQVIASVLFSGSIRDEERGVAERFSEIWQVQHAWDRPDDHWIIAGIRRVEI